ncbi:ectonucleoside triphosphate diphosphohydrolase 6 [Platysternon megacephalum]|uniref:Ectonucleoside triphosphate diphosphohydrolase 6 n=1 Tax=Platysternon megacephalum TaxID=55544 RepID=A0A4D9E6Q1_9SAUR|nr:ectonucleoside triphosphate diphosphohydrolase 6 [Platysternon megacephalum]
MQCFPREDYPLTAQFLEDKVSGIMGAVRCEQKLNGFGLIPVLYAENRPTSFCWDLEHQQSSHPLASPAPLLLDAKEPSTESEQTLVLFTHRSCRANASPARQLLLWHFALELRKRTMGKSAPAQEGEPEVSLKPPPWLA